LIEALTGVLFVAACIAGSFRPSWAIALVISMYSFEQSLQASIALFTRIPSLANVAVALAVGVCALRETMKSPQPLLGYFSKTWWCIMILFLAGSASLIWTPAFESALELTRWGLPYLILTLIMAPLLSQGIRSIQDSLKALIILGAAINGLILLNPQFTFKVGRLGTDLDALTRSNPLTLGEFGGCVFIAAALYRSQSASIAFSFTRAIAAATGAAVCLLSGSRGQLLFAVVLSLSIFPFAVRLKNIAAFVGSVVAILIIGASLYLVAAQVLGFQELRRWDSAQLESGTAVRVYNALDLVWAFAKSPIAWIVGLGFNAFVAITDSQEPYSHLLFLDILTEQGIPMFVVLCIMLWTVTKDLVWIFRNSIEDQDARAAFASLMGLYVYQLLLVNKQGYLWCSMLFFLFAIMISRARRWDEDSRLHESSGSSVDWSDPSASREASEISNQSRAPA
jgi:hypothetical protein